MSKKKKVVQVVDGWLPKYGYVVFQWIKGGHLTCNMEKKKDKFFNKKVRVTVEEI